MTDLHGTLNRLAMGFVAQGIMVPLERLIYADDEEHANELETNDKA